ncbi:hypothetical protein AVEN_65-1 [Araneus ventricosus]|uniref:Uncharacterized protein n=1 Tax=Araneus ventricosus TaxID=182803 RepID=A0A4Y2KKZ4_ARAVE|nr:hypothetical protein AVEN_65-1 [Araneus ventricosus]
MTDSSHVWTPDLGDKLGDHLGDKFGDEIWDLKAPLKPEVLGRIRHELDSPNMGGHLPHNPTPAIGWGSVATVPTSVNQIERRFALEF